MILHKITFSMIQNIACNKFCPRSLR